ncbi:MAG TPA: glutathione peroxidase [Candidatus Tumulicola sp.]
MTELQQIPITTIDGCDTTLGEYAGKVLLVVNTASKCGLTPQYEGLETLSKTYRDKGLEVLGFPSNDFAGQEPLSESEIADFCSVNYAIDFPMFSKIAVVGENKHPLYAELISQRPDVPGTEQFREGLVNFGVTPNAAPEVLWNFEKFLVGRDGNVVDRFSPDVAPNDGRLRDAIERELSR